MELADTLNRKVSRRAVVKAGLGLAGLGLASTITGCATVPSQTKVLASEQVLPSGKKETTDPNTKILNEILALPPHTVKRQELENRFAASVQTLAQVDQGLWVTSDIDIRGQLLKRRTELRQTAVPTPLISWARRQNLNPEVLGICLEANKKIQELQIIKKLQNLGPIPTKRGSILVVPKNVMANDLLINPGGMAKLIDYETNGFVNIGEGVAAQEIKSGSYGDVTADLTQLCRILSAELNLNLKPEHIPGSLRQNPNENASGGAIGLQFMPDNALLFHQILQKVDYQFNPFDVVSSVIGAWVFLAAREEFPAPNGKPTVRYNYQRGDGEALDRQRRAAIEKWNPNKQQIEAVISAANDFYSALIQPGIFIF